MISGDKTLRNFSYPVPDPPKSDWYGTDLTTQSALAQHALGFNCLNYAAAPEGSLYRHFMPDKSFLDAQCLDGLRLELMFPSCWNGVDLDSENHRSHVAFPDQVMTGSCPEGFPVKLPSLFYETIWNTYAFAGIDGQFVLSQGDPTGESWSLYTQSSAMLTQSFYRIWVPWRFHDGLGLCRSSARRGQHLYISERAHPGLRPIQHPVRLHRGRMHI